MLTQSLNVISPQIAHLHPMSYLISPQIAHLHPMSYLISPQITHLHPMSYLISPKSPVYTQCHIWYHPNHLFTPNVIFDITQITHLHPMSYLISPQITHLHPMSYWYFQDLVSSLQEEKQYKTYRAWYTRSLPISLKVTQCHIWYHPNHPFTLNVIFDITQITRLHTMSYLIFSGLGVITPRRKAVQDLQSMIHT